MCWNGRNCPIIADMDIPVFKIGLQKKSNKKIYSYFQFMEYELGITYRSNINIIDYDRWFRPSFISILEGLHSYSMDAKLMQYDTCISVVYNNKAVASYNTYDKNLQLCKIECTIPRGAVYYKNEYGELVSDSLRIKNIENIIVKEKRYTELIEFQ